MRDAFTESADFSRMCRNTTNLQITDLAHKSTFEVNQKGTGGHQVDDFVHPGETVVGSIVKIDRPFSFFVHKTDVPAVLFAGRYVKPE